MRIGAVSDQKPAQLDIAGIDPKRIEQVVTHRLVEIPVLPKLLALPIFAGSPSVQVSVPGSSQCGLDAQLALAVHAVFSLLKPPTCNS